MYIAWMMVELHLWYTRLSNSPNITEPNGVECSARIEAWQERQ
jgi:hypothetical protein